MPSSLLALESICLVQSVYVALWVHKRVWEEGMIHQYQVTMTVLQDYLFPVHVPPVSSPFPRFMTSLIGFLLEHSH